jgi:hypothetical protein
MHFSFYDMMGRVRSQGVVSKTIDVSDLRNGLYFLELRNHAGQRTGMTKVIISR